jgi:anaerobic ribonucleoside-triphosphate reductase activating protein
LLYGLNLSGGIILFSGFTIDEINNSNLRECLNYIDVLIDGRYVEEERISSGLRGSGNQNIIYFSDKIKDLEYDQEIEIGDGYLTGFPLIDKRYLKEMGIRLL